MREKESSAAQTIQSIRTCQAGYSGRNKGKFATFADLVKSGCLDEDKYASENPVVGGYVFTMKVENPTAPKPAFYSINADPLDVQNNARHFYYDSTLGTMRMTDANRPARAGDPSI